MQDNNDEKSKEQEEQKNEAIKPEPETLGTHDPQEQMEGPFSSVIQIIKDSSSDEVSKEEAEKEKDKNM